MLRKILFFLTEIALPATVQYVITVLLNYLYMTFKNPYFHSWLESWKFCIFLRVLLTVIYGILWEKFRQAQLASNIENLAEMLERMDIQQTKSKTHSVTPTNSNYNRP